MAQQRNEREQSTNLIPDELFYAVFVGILAVATWSLGKPFWVFIVSLLWKLDLFVIGLFTNQLDTLSDQIFYSIPYATLDFSKFWEVNTTIGTYSRFFWCAMIFGGACYIFMKGDVKSKFKRKYTVERLLDAMSGDFPHNKIFFSAKVDHGENGVGIGGALKPREFANKYKLLDADDSVIIEKAEAVFIQQLGPLYNGWEAWIPNKSQHYKIVLMAIMLLKYIRSKDGFKNYRNKVSREFNKTGTVESCFEEGLSVLRKNSDSDFFKRIKKYNAYEYTAFYTAFKSSKKGVFAPNEIRWVKKYNRTLYYTINSVDRRVGWVEAAAPKAHWIAEGLLKRAIKTPVVEQAIVGLVEAVIEVVEKKVEEY